MPNSTTTHTPVTCTNGHPARQAGERFCGICGQPMIGWGRSSDMAGTSRRRLGALIGGIAAVGLAAGVGLGLSAHSGSAPVAAVTPVARTAAPATAPPAPSSAPTNVPTGPTGPTAPAWTESAASPPPSDAASRQAASNLEALLDQSSGQRSVVDAAANDVEQCTDGGANWSSDQSTLEAAASERQTLISDLQNLDVSTVPDGSSMVGVLVSGWDASAQADSDYAAYAADQADGCVANDGNDDAAHAADQQATSDKSAFVALWNPVASRLGLPTTSADQI